MHFIQHDSILPEIHHESLAIKLPWHPSAKARESPHKLASRVVFEYDWKHEANGPYSADVCISVQFAKYAR